MQLFTLHGSSICREPLNEECDSDTYTETEVLIEKYWSAPTLLKKRILFNFHTHVKFECVVQGYRMPVISYFIAVAVGSIGNTVSYQTYVCTAYTFASFEYHYREK